MNQSIRQTVSFDSLCTYALNFERWCIWQSRTNDLLKKPLVRVEFNVQVCGNNIHYYTFMKLLCLAGGN